MIALQILALVALLGINAFFVVAEFSLVRARKARLEVLAEDGDRGAKLALKQLDQITAYLSSSQLGVTLTSIAIGFLGEPVVAGLLEPLFGSLPHGVAVVVGVLVAYFTVTSLHLVVGEQVPKMVAISRAETSLRKVSRPLEFFSSALRPFIAVLNFSSNALLKLLGVKVDQEFNSESTVDELKIQITESLSGGKIDPGEAGMLSGVFHLHEQEARQVMTPVPAIVVTDVSDTVQDALKQCVKSGHTRLVVTEEHNKDRIRGFVHANVLARDLINHGPDAPIAPLVRSLPIVPESKPLDDLLAELQRQRTSLAVVIDEYGRTAGIVSIEDIIEEIVGEIDDETDPAGGDIRNLTNGDWLVRGHVALTDLIDYGIDIKAETDAYNSVGGFVFNELGRLPRRGDTVNVDGYAIRVESIKENRIETIRIRPR